MTILIAPGGQRIRGPRAQDDKKKECHGMTILIASGWQEKECHRMTKRGVQNHPPPPDGGKITSNQLRVTSNSQRGGRNAREWQLINRFWMCWSQMIIGVIIACIIAVAFEPKFISGNITHMLCIWYIASIHTGRAGAGRYRWHRAIIWATNTFHINIWRCWWCFINTIIILFTFNLDPIQVGCARHGIFRALLTPQTSRPIMLEIPAFPCLVITFLATFHTTAHTRLYQTFCLHPGTYRCPFCLTGAFRWTGGTFDTNIISYQTIPSLIYRHNSCDTVTTGACDTGFHTISRADWSWKTWTIIKIFTGGTVNITFFLFIWAVFIQFQ